MHFTINILHGYKGATCSPQAVTVYIAHLRSSGTATGSKDTTTCILGPAIDCRHSDWWMIALPPEPQPSVRWKLYYCHCRIFERFSSVCLSSLLPVVPVLISLSFYPFLQRHSTVLPQVMLHSDQM